MLLKALKEISEEDREFLAAKYDRPNIRKGESGYHPNDAIVADELGMSAKEYTKKRRRIQKELREIMEQQRLEVEMK